MHQFLRSGLIVEWRFSFCGLYSAGGTSVRAPCHALVRTDMQCLRLTTECSRLVASLPSLLPDISVMNKLLTVRVCLSGLPASPRFATRPPTSTAWAWVEWFVCLICLSVSHEDRCGDGNFDQFVHQKRQTKANMQTFVKNPHPGCKDAIFSDLKISLLRVDRMPIWISKKKKKNHSTDNCKNKQPRTRFLVDEASVSTKSFQNVSHNFIYFLQQHNSSCSLPEKSKTRFNLPR